MHPKKLNRFLRDPLTYVILAAILIKLAFLVFRYHLLIWDEAVYIGMGRWIFSGGSIGIWESIRPVGLPLILGLLWKSGLGSVRAADILMMLFSTGAVVMTFLISERIFSRKIAVISASLVLITPIFFYESQLILTGIPSLFFTLLSLYMVMRKRYIAAGILSAAAFALRYPAGLIFAVINIVLLYETLKDRDWKAGFRRLMAYNIPFILVISLYLIYDKLAYGSFLGPLLLASQHQSVASRNVTGIVQSIVYYPYTLIITNVLLVFFLVPAFLRKKDLRTYYIAMPLAVFYLYFAVIPHKEPRFALLFLPYIAILASAGFFRLTELLKKFRLLWIVFVVFSVLLLLLPLGIDAVLFYTTASAEPGFVQDYNMFFRGPVDGFILTSDPVPAAYSDNRFIGYYSNLPDAVQILDRDLEKAYAIIYTPASFPCQDAACNEPKSLLEKRISNFGNLAFNKTINGEERLIYVK